MDLLASSRAARSVAMTGDGQLCSVVKTSEFVAERWTWLIWREFRCGPGPCNDRRRRLPLMSKASFAQRLRALEQRGVISITTKVIGPSDVRASTTAGEDVRRSSKRWGSGGGAYPGDPAARGCRPASPPAVRRWPDPALVLPGPARRHELRRPQHCFGARRHRLREATPSGRARLGAARPLRQAAQTEVRLPPAGGLEA
ncbi:hypothetical protein GWK16_12325 [Roseomonas sp. JC162]|uniref:HTH hxlR-type domain-containing protein n=2 Tax=Neoroseomonas marina TaxID=1232220 RepID=A0A848ED56_9PROT|nr:hypothetical protein [Neoroseomonas marina]